MVKGSTSVQQEEDYLCCLKGIKVTERLNIGRFAAHMYYGICKMGILALRVSL